MIRIQRIWPACVSFLLAAACWLAGAAQALAAEPPKKDEGSINDYMLSYLVVILGIILGLLVVAKASNRRDRDRPAGYVEKKIMGDDE
jgi:hypothetical protein